MGYRVPLAWLQLKHERMRFAAGIVGVTFAVTLIFMQIGFQQALFASVVTVAQALRGDLVLINPQTEYVAATRTFSRRRIYQAAAFDGVASVSPLYGTTGVWRNLDTTGARTIFVIGIDLDAPALDLPAVQANTERLRREDTVMFESSSRPEYGPVADYVKAGKPVHAEIEHRRAFVAGLYSMGMSFGFDGSIITSSVNFMRRFPDRDPGEIDLGVIRLKPGVNAEAMRLRLEKALPHDVVVLTKAGFIQREHDYWAASQPIGFVFGFGTIMGLIVGAVIVYQILFADISSHLPEYATLKAIGYSNGYLYAVVFEEALILAVLGFVPGLALCTWLYQVTEQATLMPMRMRPGTIVLVLSLTVAMACGSAAIALGKARSADPASIF